jgi:hypothetical protein
MANLATPTTPLRNTNAVLTQAPVIQGAKAIPNLASDVVIFFQDGRADIWTDRFVKAQPGRRKSVLMGRNPTINQIVSAIDSAARLAGRDGILIFNVGHGGSSSSTEGLVDVAPDQKMRLGGQGVTNVFVNVFYDVNLAGPNGFSDMDNDVRFNAGSPAVKQRMANWQIYKNIGRIIRNAGIRRVIFLTCNLGNATDFIKKVANDWNTVVEAYRKQIKLDPQANGNVRMHLVGDAPGTGTNIPDSEHEIPLATESNSYRAGPP